MRRVYFAGISLLLTLTIAGCARKKEEAKIIEPETWSALAPATEQQEPIIIVPSEITSPSPALSEAEQQLLRNKKIQEALKISGYYDGEIDGKVGPKTKKAIREFQTAKGLASDGVVGPKTWAELEKVLFLQIKTTPPPTNKPR